MGIDVFGVLFISLFVANGAAFCVLHFICDRVIADIRNRFPSLAETLNLPEARKWLPGPAGQRGVLAMMVIGFEGRI